MSDDENEEFQISNLLSYFKKNNIQVHGVFSHEGCVRLLFIQYMNTGLDVFLYIPSKYTIKTDNSMKNYFHVSLRHEEEDEDSVKTVPSIFTNSSLEFNKKSIETSLKRFIPMFSELHYKLVYIDKEYLCYINRYDDIDTFTFIQPFNKKGFFFMIDLEKFYKLGSSIEKDLNNMETLLYTKIYNSIDGELPALYDTLNGVALSAKKFSGRNTLNTYIDRTRKVSEIYSNVKKQGKPLGECLNVISNIRKDNFETLFYMEKIVQLLKELKELREPK